MKTYINTPVDPQTVWAALVAQAESNLASDTSVSVPRVNFMYETWPKLQELLALKAKNPNEKNVRFPLVALIRKSSSNWKADDEGFTMNHTLIIVTKSEATKKLEDRIAENYIPTLRPIRDELLRLVKNTPYFHGYISTIPDCVIDENYQFNQEAGAAYKLGDALDGIVIDDLRLVYNPPMVEMYRPAPTKTLVYLNDVQQLRVAGQSTSTLSVQLFAAQYVDSLGVGAGLLPKYYVHFGHDTEGNYQINVLGSAVVSTISNEVSGTFTGRIFCDDGVKVADLGFIYVVENGIIKHHTTDNNIKLENIATATDNYPNYDIDVYANSSHTRNAISNMLITSEGGIVLKEYYYNPNEDATGALTETLSLLSAGTYRDLATVITLEGTTIESYSYYKLQ